MSLNSKTRADRLAIAYQSNFICLLKIANIIENTDKRRREEIDAIYLDEGYHCCRSQERETDLSRSHVVAMDMDIAVHRPLLVTCCRHDSTLRVWNYLTLECVLAKCLTLQHTSGSPEPVKPLAVAFHPTGYMIAAGFDSQIILWHLLHGELRQFFVFTSYRHCSKLKFSHNGQSLAIAQMLPTLKCVYIHNIYTLEKQHAIKVPAIASVCDIVFNNDDLLITLCCTEGVLIMYDTQTKTETMLYSKYKTTYTSCKIINKEEVIAFGADEFRKGFIRKVTKDNSEELIDSIEDKLMHGQILNNDIMFAGTENGLIKFFEYSQPTKEYGTHNFHAGPVSKLKMSPNGKYGFSCGEDGVIFIYSICQRNARGLLENKSPDEYSAIPLNKELANVILIEKGQVEKERNFAKQQFEKVKSLESEMAIREKTKADLWEETLKELELEKKNALAELEARISTLKEELTKKEQQYCEAMKKFDANHSAAIADLEAVFKAKLDREKRNNLNLEQNMKEIVQSLKDEIDKKEKQKQKELADEHVRYEKDLEKLNKKIKEVKESQTSNQRLYEDKLTLQEEEHDKEIDKRELDLNKEINRMAENLKKKDEEINRLETNLKDLKDANQDLHIQIGELLGDKKNINAQFDKAQEELKKAQKDRESSIEELNEVKGKLLKQKSKQKETDKNRQVISDLAKSLKEKVSPLVNENTDLKKNIKGIEEEYQEYIEILEKQKNTMDHQLAIIGQQKEQIEEKDKKIKEKEERLQAVSNKIFQFRQRLTVNKQDYATLFNSLYEDYVGKNTDRYWKNPEVQEEFDHQIQYLKDEKASIERQSQNKEDQLTKICKSLRSENVKLIDDLNKTMVKLRSAENTIHLLQRDAASTSALKRDKGDASSMSLTMRLSKIRENSVPPPKDRLRIQEFAPIAAPRRMITMRNFIRKAWKDIQRTFSTVESIKAS